MALKKKWKRFGKDTGKAFTNFGKSVKANRYFKGIKANNPTLVRFE